MANPLLDRVARAPLLLDSGMGTRLMALGLDLAEDDPCLWVESHPDAVLAAHRADVAAGAEALFSNTFGANRAWLDRFGRGSDADALNRRAVALARTAAGPNRFVLGSIGPTSLGPGSDPAALVEQAQALLDAGGDALVLETFRLDGAIAALRALGATGRPTWVGLFDWPDPIRPAMDALIEAGASLVGLNCTYDPGAIDRFLAALASPGAPLGWIKPSGGAPGGPPVPDDAFRAFARRVAVLRSGAMGGCCGTTSHHLALIRGVWEDEVPEQHF